jgi:predicted P-loop ATPase
MNGGDTREDSAVDLDKVRRAKRRRSSDSGGPDWLEGALCGDNGRTLAILHNVALALRAAPQIAEAFAFDLLNRRIVVTRRLPLADGAAPRNVAPPPRDLDEGDVVQVAEWLQTIGLPRVRSLTVREAILLRAQERAFHPVRDHLNGVTWDGMPRLTKWLTTYLGAKPTPYTEAIGRMFLISAVARVFEPGCKADYMLVLEGDQGFRKSTACRLLGEPWFSESLPDNIRSKDAKQHLRGKWIIEIGELAAFDKAETEYLKAFLTRAVEDYRAPYGRDEVSEPRQCVFIGTTNKRVYLKDETGARRFWPVALGKIDLEALARDRDQIFAEAVAAYRAGEQWWPEEDFEEQHIRTEQGSRFEADAWEAPIAAFLLGKARVQVTEVARHALGIVAAKIGTAEQRRIASVLTSLRWTPGRDWQGRFYQPPKTVARYIPR